MRAAALCVAALAAATPTAEAGKRNPERPGAQDADTGPSRAARVRALKRALKSKVILRTLSAPQGARLKLSSVSGALGRDEALAALRKGGARAEKCVIGTETLELALKVERDGRVKSATPLNSVVKDRKAARCARRALRRALRFPRKRRGSAVRVTIAPVGSLLNALTSSPSSGGHFGVQGAGTDGGKGPSAAAGKGAGRPGGRAAAQRSTTSEGVPRIRRGKAVVGDGPYPRAAINRVIRRHAAQVSRCYNQRLKRTPGLRGKVTLRFVITPAGRVASAAVASDTTGDPKVGACLVRRAASWRFPRPRGSGRVIVRYPFVFGRAR